MKKTLISTAVAATFAFTATSANALVLTLLDNTTTPSLAGVTIDPANGAAFAAGNEFRVANGGAFAGFGEKSITGDQAMTWTFDGAGEMTAVSGTDMVPAASMVPPVGGSHLGSGVGLFQNATFFGGGFGFLAPIGSAAAHGPATITFDSTDNYTIHFPVMEAHWNGASEMLGASTGGITFTCNGALAPGVGHCQADNLIIAAEDTAGFAGQYTQWSFDVSLDTPHVPDVPVPAAAWLFGSGLLGLVGVARRKKAVS